MFRCWLESKQTRAEGAAGYLNSRTRAFHKLHRPISANTNTLKIYFVFICGIKMHFHQSFHKKTMPSTERSYTCPLLSPDAVKNTFGQIDFVCCILWTATKDSPPTGWTWLLCNVLWESAPKQRFHALLQCTKTQITVKILLHISFLPHFFIHCFPAWT